MVEIQMISGRLHYDDQPLCTDQDIDQALAVVAGRQDDLFQLLPDDHMWKAGKQEHMTRAHEAKQPIVDRFRGVICPVNFRLLEFIFRVHDLGRVIEGAHTLGTLPDGISYCGDHAEQSVLILQSWGALDSFSDQTRHLIEFVIRHHVGSYSPVAVGDLRDRHMSTTLLFTCLLRDADKYLIFRDRTRSYLYDGDKKSGEIRQHGLRGETGSIDPEDFLQAFTGRQVLDRKRMRSYEGYMLYLLSWLYDVNLREVLDAIVETGAPSMLVEYFYQQLPSETAALIDRAIGAYLTSRGITLA